MGDATRCVVGNRVATPMYCSMYKVWLMFNITHYLFNDRFFGTLSKWKGMLLTFFLIWIWNCFCMDLPEILIKFYGGKYFNSYLIQFLPIFLYLVIKNAPNKNHTYVSFKPYVLDLKWMHLKCKRKCIFLIDFSDNNAILICKHVLLYNFYTHIAHTTKCHSENYPQ